MTDPAASVHRALLRLYPRSFRNEYGADIVLIATGVVLTVGHASASRHRPRATGLG